MVVDGAVDTVMEEFPAVKTTGTEHLTTSAETTVAGKYTPSSPFMPRAYPGSIAVNDCEIGLGLVCCDTTVRNLH